MNYYKIVCFNLFCEMSNAISLERNNKMEQSFLTNWVLKESHEGDTSKYKFKIMAPFDPEFRSSFFSFV